MRNKIFRHIIAAASACTMLFSVYPMPVNADIAAYYEPTGASGPNDVGPSLFFTSSTISMEEAQEPQYVTLKIKSPNNTKFQSTGMYICFDENIEILPIRDNSNKYAEILLDEAGKVTKPYPEWNAVHLASSASSHETYWVATEEGIDYARVRVRLKDPKPGKKYNYTVGVRKDNGCFTNRYDEQEDIDKMQDYLFTHVEPGYIQIEGELEDDSSIADHSGSYDDTPREDGSTKAMFYTPTGKAAESGYIGATLELSSSTISMADAQIPQYVELKIKSPNNTQFDSVGLHIFFDTDVEVLPYDEDEPDEFAHVLINNTMIQSSMDLYWNSVCVTSTRNRASTATEEGTPYCRIRVRLKDPTPGKTYNYTIAYRDTDCFKYRHEENLEAMEDYAFSHVIPGSITIDDADIENSVPERDDNDSKVIKVPVDSSSADVSSEAESSKAEESSKTDASSESEVSSKTEESSKADASSESEVSSKAEESSKADASSESEVSSKAEESSKADAKPDSSKSENDSADRKGTDGSSSSEAAEYWLLGDVNNDKVIDIEDAVLLMNHINGMKALDEFEMLRGDVDLSKDIDVEDVATLMGHINGIKVINGTVKIPDAYKSKN